MARDENGKFGIQVFEKDSTPGFRSRDSWVWWYATEAERDEAYEYLTRPVDAGEAYIRNKGVSDSNIDRWYDKTQR